MANHPPLDRTSLQSGFDRASDRYDLMVAFNPGYRRHLRRAADALLDLVEGTTPVLLDLGCGSGISTQELVRAAQRRRLRPRVIGVDASEGMLSRARAKQWPVGVDFVHGFGESLEDLGLPRADGALACYLLRNVTDLEATLEGVAGVLSAGAPFVAEEYSVSGSASAERRWHRVNRGVIMPLARHLTQDASVYEYLHRSVDDFCTIPELAARLEAAGFVDIAHRTVPGWQRDILHLVRARRG